MILAHTEKRHGKRGKHNKPLKEWQWEKVFEAFRVGAELIDAAHSAGIGIKRLKFAMEMEVDLSKKCRRLLADCKVHHLRRVFDAEKNWQASAWFLERVFQDKYALRSKHEIREDEEKAVQIRKVVIREGVPTRAQVLAPSEN